MINPDWYVVAIVLTMPVISGLLMVQKNPYNALILRGILGAIAVLAYSLFGAADVALTEALVGTLLSITLYAVAVRSSMVMRVGVVAADPESDPYPQITGALKQVLQPHHLRLETVVYGDRISRDQALENREIHGIIEPHTEGGFGVHTRVLRLYEILKSDALGPQIHLSHGPLPPSTSHSDQPS